MSETTETTTENGPEGTPPEGAAPAGGNAEAAKWRTKLREAEGERDTLAGRIQDMQKAEATRLAGAHLKKADGLWAAGAELDDLLDEAGNVDADKVKTAALSAADQLGLERPKAPGVVPSEGGNGRPAVKKSFEDAFKIT